jgi:hypothetical protein
MSVALCAAEKIGFDLMIGMGLDLFSVPNAAQGMGLRWR